MEPERPCKSEMISGPTAASWISPPLDLRTAAFLSNQPGPPHKIQAIVNAASFQTGMPNVGGLASIFVSCLTGTPGLVTAQSLPLPSQLAGISVAIDGIPGPILAIYSSTRAGFFLAQTAM